MERDKIKYYLYSYKRLQNMIEESKKKIDEYNTTIIVIENTYCSVSACIADGMPHGSSVNSDKILNQIERKDKEVENIRKLVYKESLKINEYIKMYSVISKIILEADAREHDLITEYYFNKNRMVETCYLIGCSTSTFKRVNNNILEEIRKEIGVEKV